MRNEVSSAVDFLSTLISTRGKGWIDSFKENLSDILCEHYQNHWFPEKPFKGSAYRCIRITGSKIDPLLQRAASSCGISCAQLLAALPQELTMWVDPEEVSYRIGEEGSIGVLYDGATDTSDGSSSESESSVSDRDSPVMYHQDRDSPLVYHPFPMDAQSHTQVFYQSCKNQYRNMYYPGMPSGPMEYYSAFVSS